MSSFLIAFLFTVGASTWAYGRLQRNTGNDTRRSLTAVSISGLLLFVIVYLVLKSF
ncbi:hypothetical protein HY380_00510 [Candidatus Saccharibacteria bacterium]|nr:hypothetical protein [Candidatus Saccharibacteria bacterium]